MNSFTGGFTDIKLVHVSQADSQENRIELLFQFRQFQFFPETDTATGFDATNGKDKINLTLGETIHGFVGGNAVFVQAAQFFPGFKNHHIMAEHREPVSTGESCRTSANDRNLFATGRGSLEKRVPFFHQPVGGIPLEFSDPDRLPFLGVPHTDSLTKYFGRTYSGAHATHDVLA